MIPVPRAALAALAQSYGTTADQLTYFSGGREESDGVIYAYPSGSKRRLLKILPVPADNQRKGRLTFEARLQFMRFLGEHGARIAFPLLSPQENIYETTQAEEHLWIGYAMEIIPGRTPRDKTWDEPLFRSWGQTIGQLHRLAQEYPTWQATVDPADGTALLGWEGEWTGFYNWCQEAEVKEQWGQIKTQLETLPVNREVFGFIHNDPHIWNLQVQGSQVTLLDFDVANHHWFINDIAIACQHILIFHSGGLNGPLRDQDQLMKFLDCFMTGYRQENQLPPGWLNHLDLFISYRRILLFIVMYGWAQSQPRLYQNWKGLILSPPELVGTFE